MADYRTVKRMRSEKALREKRKKDALKNIKEEPKKEPSEESKEKMKELLELWQKSKKKNEDKI